MITNYKNLGCMNGWNKNPKLFDDCVRKNHSRTRKCKGNCYNEYYCHICHIKYQVDSS